MNILLTGVTGFIGRKLLIELQKTNKVFVLVRPESDRTGLSACQVFEFTDNEDQLVNYLVKNKIDGIVHLASLYLAQHKSEQLKDLILSNIYLGTVLLEAAKQVNLKWFLNTGTIWQNFRCNSVEYHPVNLYAATKQAFVDIAKYYTETSNLKFCTLKLCDTYGPGDTRKKVLALFKQIAQTGEILNMSPGEQKIDLLHIDDVIAGFLKLIFLLNGNEEVESEYVLSSGCYISLKDLAQLYMSVSGQTLLINWGGREYREREVMLPWQKGKVLPSWSVSKPIEVGIAEFCKLS